MITHVVCHFGSSEPLRPPKAKVKANFWSELGSRHLEFESGPQAQPWIRGQLHLLSKLLSKLKPTPGQATKRVLQLNKLLSNLPMVRDKEDGATAPRQLNSRPRVMAMGVGAAALRQPAAVMEEEEELGTVSSGDKDRQRTCPEASRRSARASACSCETTETAGWSVRSMELLRGRP